MEIGFFLLLRWKFPQLYNTIYQKRLLRPKSHTGTFSALMMEFGTYSTLPVDFSPVETGIFERCVLIPFHGYAGNPTLFSYHKAPKQGLNNTKVKGTVMADSKDNNPPQYGGPSPDKNPPRPFEIEEPDGSETEIETIPPDEEEK